MGGGGRKKKGMRMNEWERVGVRKREEAAGARKMC